MFTWQDSDVHVTYEDQQKINLFARTNARLQDLKEELDAKKVYLYWIYNNNSEQNWISMSSTGSMQVSRQKPPNVGYM